MIIDSYKDRGSKFEIAFIPQHKRTILRQNSTVPEFKFVPSCYAIFRTNGNNQGGILVDQKINFFIRYKSGICTNGLVVNSISEYLDWFWNSKFELDVGEYYNDYQPITTTDLCGVTWLGNYIRYLAIKEQNTKLLKNFRKHRRRCPLDMCNRFTDKEIISKIEENKI